VIGQEDFIIIDTNVLVEVLRNEDKGRPVEETYLSNRAERPLISMISLAFASWCASPEGRRRRRSADGSGRPLPGAPSGERSGHFRPDP